MKKVIGLMLLSLTLSHLLIADTQAVVLWPDGEYVWSDGRAYISFGPAEVMRQALAELRYFGVTKPLDGAPGVTWAYDFPTPTPIRGFPVCPDVDACLHEWYGISVTSSVIRMRDIWLQTTLFTRGYVCIDDDGDFLTNDDDKFNLRYQFASCLFEGVEFTLAHEIAHTLGIPEDADAIADEFAMKVIFEIRKAHAGLAYDLRPVYAWFDQNLEIYANRSGQARTDCSYEYGPAPKIKIH